MEEALEREDQARVERVLRVCPERLVQGRLLAEWQEPRALQGAALPDRSVVAAVRRPSRARLIVP